MLYRICRNNYHLDSKNILKGYCDKKYNTGVLININIEKNREPKKYVDSI